MKKILFAIFIILLVVGLFYLYLVFVSQKKYPVEYGISFNRQHAESLGLDWKEVYLDMLQDLKPKYVRIAATWNETEFAKDEYDFSDIDWQMNKAKENNVKVILVLGQKAPRWPECHVPAWTNTLSDDDYKEKLFGYLEKVVARYKNNEALELWQVENEPFIKFRFGECKNFKENLVKGEISLVKKLDHDHKIIITDSGELSTWWGASRAGDLFGTTLYRIVRTPGGRIWTYDFLPPAFYRIKAQILGMNMNEVFVSELQAEPWFTGGNSNDTPLEIQMETMNKERLQEHFDYVEKIGVSRAYLWGVEWWYWMKEKQGDSSFWELVKGKISLGNNG